MGRTQSVTVPCRTGRQHCPAALVTQVTVAGDCGLTGLAGPSRRLRAPDSESWGRRVSLLFNENPRLLHMKVLYLCVLLASFQYQGQSYRLGSWKHIGFFPGQHSKSHVGFCNSKRTPIRPNLAVLVGSASAASESLSQQKSLLSWDLLDAGQADTNSSTDDDVEHWEV